MEKRSAVLPLCTQASPRERSRCDANQRIANKYSPQRRLFTQCPPAAKPAGYPKFRVTSPKFWEFRTTVDCPICAAPTTSRSRRSSIEWSRRCTRYAPIICGPPMPPCILACQRALWKNIAASARARSIENSAAGSSTPLPTSTPGRRTERGGQHPILAIGRFFQPSVCSPRARCGADHAQPLIRQLDLSSGPDEVAPRHWQDLMQGPLFSFAKRKMYRALLFPRGRSEPMSHGALLNLEYAEAPDRNFSAGSAVPTIEASAGSTILLTGGLVVPARPTKLQIISVPRHQSFST